MKTTIHPDIADLLARAHDLADIPAPERTGATVKISIRVPHGTPEAVRTRALALGVPFRR